MRRPDAGAAGHPFRPAQHDEPAGARPPPGQDRAPLFRRTIEGQAALPVLYWTEEEPDLDFDAAVGTESCVAEAWESWRREVAHGREVYEQYPDVGEAFVPGEPWTVRGVVVHLIEEYARHVGHADLLRECVDGRTGQ